MNVSFQFQLGYVKINLAEFAGQGTKQRKYLIQSYNEIKHKPDNSLLKVRLPAFKSCVSLMNTPYIYMLLN